MSEYIDLDNFSRVNIFCGPKTKGSKSTSVIQCDHNGFLKYDGYNTTKTTQRHRVYCSKCGKRFGNKTSLYHLLVYQTKLKKITYEIFKYKYNLKGIAQRWGVAPEMLSRFKKMLVKEAYRQNTEKIETHFKSLPRGVILGDETYMG